MRGINEILDVLEQAKDVLGGLAGVDFNYSPRSLEKLEVALNDMFPFGRKTDVAVSILIGVYLGEVIVRNIKEASWGEFNTKDPFETEVIVKKGEMTGHVKPLLRAYKFLNRDRTDALSVFYYMNKAMLEDKLKHNTGAEWQEDGPYMYRSLKVTKEEHEAGLSYEQILENRKKN